ncbi:NADH-quinone oxidoreductase subunit J, partial [Streptomyces sp. NPDC053048]|uniref:NADH-quinone oxidoreductase subunit J n=1 Tax=Streptomyces sp. NPDC053048 TaxID=3365694 RepID=UPI0037CF3B9D
MWKNALRALAAVLLTAVIPVGPATAAPSPSPSPSDNAMCKTARRNLDAGYLDRAQKLYSDVPVTADPTGCAEEGLQNVAKARQDAVDLAAKGQREFRDGDLDAADKSFHEALAKDRSNVAAQDGVSRVDDLQGRPIQKASSRWDNFYDNWIFTIAKLVLFMVAGTFVLLSASGLLSGFIVKVGAIAWSESERKVSAGVGLALIIFTAGIFPAYVMFTPFTPGTPLLWAAGIVILAIAVLIFYMVARVSKRLTKQVTPRQGSQVWRDWAPMLLALVAIILLGVLLSCTELTTPQRRLMGAYAVLVAFGILITAAAAGQKLRLQVEAQFEGSINQAFTDYLLARMQGLGTESPKRFQAASILDTTPLSNLTMNELSALPSGTFASLLSRMFFALNPGYTWRARAVIVDDNRVAVTIFRNGQHADSSIFSRLDLDLPSLQADPSEENAADPSQFATHSARDRARAQLLTGAAAFTLLHLSRVHLNLRDSLCGARNWKSVTLQLIATSKSLIDPQAKSISLLNRAMDEDPGYVLARFEYLWARYREIPTETTDYRSFAESMERHYHHPEYGVKDGEGWVPLRIRVLYSIATQWLNYFIISGKSDWDALQHAESATTELLEVCKATHKAGQVALLAERMLPFARNLERSVFVLGRRMGPLPPFHPHSEDPPSPKLTYDHACLDCFLLEARDIGKADDAVEDLRFALATDRDKNDARHDPCFRDLQSHEGFQQIVHSNEFLDLPVFVQHKKRLESAGLTSSRELARRTDDEAQRSAMADYLKSSPVLVDQYRDLALLAQVHLSLDDPRMLDILCAIGVTSPDGLSQAAQRDPGKLILNVRQKAAEYGLTNLPGVSKPVAWLVQAGVTKRRALAAMVQQRLRDYRAGH